MKVVMVVMLEATHFSGLAGWRLACESLGPHLPRACDCCFPFPISRNIGPEYFETQLKFQHDLAL